MIFYIYVETIKETDIKTLCKNLESTLSDKLPVAKTMALFYSNKLVNAKIQVNKVPNHFLLEFLRTQNQHRWSNNDHQSITAISVTNREYYINWLNCKNRGQLLLKGSKGIGHSRTQRYQSPEALIPPRTPYYSYA